MGCTWHNSRTSGSRGVLIHTLIKSGVGNDLFDVWVRDVHAGGDVHDMLVSLLDFRIVLHSQGHGHVVDLVGQDDIARVGKSAICTHGDEVLVVLVDRLLSDTRDHTGSPVVRVKVPNDSSQVQLGGNPSDTIINVTERLRQAM